MATYLRLLAPDANCDNGSLMQARGTSVIASARSRRTLMFHCMLLVMLALAAWAYEPLNHHIGSTHNLATSVDRQIPVVPLFALPYLAFIPLFWLLTIYALITDRDFLQLCLTAILVYTCSDIVFVIFHTIAPRPHLGTGSLDQLVRFIYAHDEPYNDLPSEHVSSALMFGLYFFAVNSRWRIPLGLYALSVVASTLLVKQHTIAGASGGVLLAIAAWLIIRRALSTLARLETGVEQDRLRDDGKQYPGRNLRKGTAS